MSDPTPQYFRDRLSYCAETGRLTWKAKLGLSHADKAWNAQRVGRVAGTVSNNGYLVVMIDRRHYLAHRLAWAIHHGVLPRADIDHIDRDRLNNRIANLREASRSQNTANTGMQRNNTSGAKGVYVNKRGAYVATIRCDGVVHRVGSFGSLEEAAAAYNRKAITLFGAFAAPSPEGK